MSPCRHRLRRADPRESRSPCLAEQRVTGAARSPPSGWTTSAAGFLIDTQSMEYVGLPVGSDCSLGIAATMFIKSGSAVLARVPTSSLMARSRIPPLLHEFDFSMQLNQIFEIVM